MDEASVQSLFDQGSAHHRAGQLQQAELLYRKILQQVPNHAAALHRLGMVAHQVGKQEIAFDLVNRAIAIDPNRGEYHNTLGEIHRSMNNLQLAESAFRRAIGIDPKVSSFQSNLSLVLRSLGRLEEAGAAARAAVELNPSSPNAQLNLANVLGDCGQYEDAIAHYQQAASLDPKNSRILTSFSAALSELGRLEEAMACLDRAIALDDSADAHFNRGLLLLLQGDFSRGWDEFEWRWRISDFSSARLLSEKPQWDGSPAPGKTILFLAEQGTGDAIQFIRYAPLAAERSGARIGVVCRPELTALFSRLEGVAGVHSTDKPLPLFDLHLPLLSLPRIFKTTIQTIPASIPYIHADSERVRYWSGRIRKGGKHRIGLVWQGRPAHNNDRNRSIALHHLSQLSTGKNVRWISLQIDAGVDQLKDLPKGLDILDLHDELTDFSETAAVIANLDLVIGVDTAVVHLAGAMGKPVWILLPFAPDWRWQMGRSDSPWYPSARLFRQPSPGQWEPVIQEIASALTMIPESE